MLNSVSNNYAYSENGVSNKKSKICGRLGAAAGAAAGAAWMYEDMLDSDIIGRPSSKKGIKGVIENLKKIGKGIKRRVRTSNGEDFASNLFVALKEDSGTYKKLVNIFNHKLARVGFVAGVIALPIIIGGVIGKAVGWFGDKALEKK